MPVQAEYNIVPCRPSKYMIPHCDTAATILKRELQLQYLERLMKPYSLHHNYETDGFNPPSDVDKVQNDLNELTLSKSDNAPLKIPKRVKFADTVGLDLVHIRHMTAGRDTPPDLSSYVFSDLNLANEKEQKPKLTIGFQQPVADYSQFRDCIDTYNISLESVSINDDSIVGTVKVKNLAFHKAVFARFTHDDWTTSHDVSAFYVNNGLANGQGNQMTSLIDTFSFTYELSPGSMNCRNIQFAVCFRCSGQEFWDNNQRKNYVIYVNSLPDSHITPSKRRSIDCYNGHLQTNWTEYAIWRNIDYTPYW